MFALRELITRMEAMHEKGQTLIEYALLVVLIAIVVIVTLRAFGPQIGTMFEDITTEFLDM